MTMQTNSVRLNNSVAVSTDKQWAKLILLHIILIALDLGMVLTGFQLAYVLRFELGISWVYQPVTSPIEFYQQIVFFLTPIWIVVFAVFGLYSFKNLFAGTREYALVFHACTLGIMLVIFFTFLEPDLIIARAWVILSWVLVTTCVMSGRFILRRVVHQVRKKGHFMTTVFIVGTNEDAQAIALQLQNNTNAGIKIVGFIDDRLKYDREPVTGIPIIGSIESILALTQQHGVQEIIIASTALSRNQLLDLVQSLQAAEIPARLSSGLYEILTSGVEVREIGNVPLLSINKARLTGSDVFMKRALDLVGASIALLLLLPIMVMIAIVIKSDSSGPIIYRRRVVGVGGKLFDAFKFRTMSTDADERLARDTVLRQEFEQNFKLKDDPRITKIGHFLRKTSLDELPQFFNVLLGQMSLVGPRMITKSECVNYGRWSINLFTVKPGITGLWQVSGRSDVSYSERVNLDMYYIRNYSIWFDIYLLWLTIPAVLKSKGAY